MIKLIICVRLEIGLQGAMIAKMKRQNETIWNDKIVCYEKCSGELLPVLQMIFTYNIDPQKIKGLCKDDSLL